MLVLSGTGDGRALVAALRSSGVAVIESVAGRTAAARALEGVRVGGFGGASGLEAWLSENAVSAVVDATHPFAARMSSNAALACAAAGVPLARWVRPSWRDRPGSAAWTWVPDHTVAARAAGAAGSAGDPVSGGRVLLTVGRQELDSYRELRDVVARVSEPPPGWTTPDGWEILVARGPFTVNDEFTLLTDRGVGVLVTKDSGGDATSAKLDAAAALGVRVVMIERPPGPTGVPGFSNRIELQAWLHGVAEG